MKKDKNGQVTRRDHDPQKIAGEKKMSDRETIKKEGSNKKRMAKKKMEREKKRGGKNEERQHRAGVQSVSL